MQRQITYETLSALLTTRYVGRRAEFHAELGSTNTRAMELAEAGAPDGTLVLAERQTAGRGRLGRRWHAPAGSSLLMSLVLRPALAPRQAQRMTMVCSLAAVEAIERLTGLRAAIKWPNDVYIGERKVGGVLTELGLQGEALRYVVVGMGLNVNFDPDQLQNVMAPATSLSAEVGRLVPRLPLLAAILEGVERRYERMRAGWSPHVEWETHLLTRGRRVSVGTEEGTFDGLAEGVDEDGALIVRRDDGALVRVLAGDVTLRKEDTHPGR